MKFVTPLLCLYAALAASFSFELSQKPLSVGKEELKVPGENPLYVRISIKSMDRMQR